ncbi:hypothetical protein ACWDRR_23470 [Kitasatospora sp. NPDC003701]
MDATAMEALVARFLAEHPRAGRAACDHPALRGCDDAPWERIPGCPAGIPVLLRALLDEAVDAEALRVLTNLLLSSVLHASAAMPVALPFLIRLAADPGLRLRTELLDLVLLVANIARPVDPDEGAAGLFGHELDHPERAECRAVFTEHATELLALLVDETLPEGLIGTDDHDAVHAVLASC